MSSERFVRWQANTINQLSFAINLFVGLATAALGFCVSLLLDEKFVPTGKTKYLFTAALACHLLSLCFGIAAVITRTLDFRFTARIARNVSKAGDEGKIELLRKRVKKLGTCTWFSFWAQLALFVLGTLFLITSIVSTYSSKLL